MGRASAPELGRSGRLLGRFHVTGVFWHRIQIWYVSLVPTWMHSLAIYGFSIFFFLVLIRIRRAIASNLVPVLGEAGAIETKRRAFRTMVEFARCRSETVSRLLGTTRGGTRVEGGEYFADAIGGGAGAILVTAHLGPWESATIGGMSAANRKVHVVREGELDPRAQELMQEQLRKLGPNYVAHNAGEDMLGLKLLEALRDGEVVALQGDRPHDRARTVTVSLFNRPYVLPAGPAALARASGRPIVPVFSFLDPDFSVCTVIRPPIYVAADGGQDDLNAAMARFGAELEAAIRRSPHQWFCFGQIWT